MDELLERGAAIQTYLKLTPKSRLLGETFPEILGDDSNSQVLSVWIVTFFVEIARAAAPKNHSVWGPSRMGR